MLLLSVAQQWIIVDLKLFKPGMASLPANLVTICEQIPGTRVCGHSLCVAIPPCLRCAPPSCSLLLGGWYSRFLVSHARCLCLHPLRRSRSHACLLRLSPLHH